jgi:hypothetical protein
MFLSDLYLIIEFLLSKIKSLDFVQVLNRLLYYFTVKINGLPSVTCISFDTPAFMSSPNVNATSSSVKSS